MDGAIAHRTPYLSLGGAGLVLVAILGGNTIFAGPGDSPTGPADITPPVAVSASPADPYPSYSKSASAPDREAQIEPPAAKPFPAEATYAGHDRRGRIAVAVVISGDRAAAYLCDGRRIEAWLTGTAIDGELSLRGERGAQLDGHRSGERLAGTFDVAGQQYRYRIQPAHKPAGLYRAESDADSVIGWIRLPSGDVVGLRSGPGGTGPAPKLTPGGSVQVDRQTIAIEEVTGRDEL